MKKARRIITGIACLLGLMLVIGTAGAMDTDAISFGQGIGQAAIGIIMFGGAGYLGGYME